MKSLCGLEEMLGASIIASLAKIHMKILKTAEVTLKNFQRKELKRCVTKKDVLEMVLKIWLPENSTLFPTWASLLLILGIIQKNNLRLHIKDLLGELSENAPLCAQNYFATLNRLYQQKCGLGAIHIEC